MKVFDLRCEHGHSFEGWFKDLAAFEGQHGVGLLQCPYCGSHEVHKALSAPRLNLSGAQEPAQPVVSPPTEVSAVTSPSESAAALGAAMQLVRQALATSEDVGARFAEEVRAISSGDAPSRSIHGQTSLETARELAEEGIPVLPIPFGDLLKSSLQ